MGTSDLKKLVTGFLILSALSSTLTLIFLNFSSNSEAPAAPSPIQVQGQEPLKISANALVESLPSGVARETTSPASGLPSRTADPANLTQNLVDTFAQEVVANNPDGPQPSENGGYTLNAPSDALVADLTSKLVSGQKIIIDENISYDDIKIISKASPEDAVSYLKSLSDILNGISSDKELNDLSANQVDDLSLNTAAKTAFRNAFDKLIALKVPDSLKDVHVGVLKILADQNKVFELVDNYKVDPVKSFVAIRGSSNILVRDIKKLGDKLQQTGEAQPKIYAFFKKAWFFSFLNNLIAVNTAYAADSSLGGAACEAIQKLTQPIKDLISENIITPIKNFLKNIFGEAVKSAVGSVVKKEIGATTAVPVNVVADNSAASMERNARLQTIVAQNECQWLYKIVLQSVKTALLTSLQNQLVAWIQGGGKPLFITNWKGFLENVGNVALGNTIDNIYPYLCTGIGPLIRISLLPVPNLAYPVRCTLTQVIQNVQNFYNNFQNGGWIAYGAVLQPSNNYFGSLIQVSDIVTRQVAAAQDAAKSQAIASQGFKGPEICAKSHVISDPEGIGDTTVCDEYKTVTPGGAVAHALYAGQDWIPQEIINAQEFEQLTAAIVNALINRLIKEGAGLLGVKT